RLRDAGPALAWNLVALGDVDHKDEVVGEGAAEGEREIVAARLDEHEIGVREPSLETGDRLEVHARVVADRGVRARARLDADDARGLEQALGCRSEMPGVLWREDVVRHDHRSPSRGEQARNERLDQRRLAGAPRPADADAPDAGCASTVFVMVIVRV